MSTSIENLRRVAKISVNDHIALFDFYVTLGRDIEHLAIRFGIDPQDIIDILEGYGEKIIVDDKLDFSGKGRLPNISRLLIDEYIQRFYPGIASENPQNDWICFESYMNQMHPQWHIKQGKK